MPLHSDDGKVYENEIDASLGIEVKDATEFSASKASQNASQSPLEARTEAESGRGYPSTQDPIGQLIERSTVDTFNQRFSGRESGQEGWWSLPNDQGGTSGHYDVTDMRPIGIRLADNITKFLKDNKFKINEEKWTEFISEQRKSLNIEYDESLLGDEDVKRFLPEGQATSPSLPGLRDDMHTRAGLPPNQDPTKLPGYSPGGGGGSLGVKMKLPEGERGAVTAKRKSNKEPDNENLTVDQQVLRYLEETPYGQAVKKQRDKRLRKQEMKRSLDEDEIPY